MPPTSWNTWRRARAWRSFRRISAPCPPRQNSSGSSVICWLSFPIPRTCSNMRTSRSGLPLRTPRNSSRRRWNKIWISSGTRTCTCNISPPALMWRNPARTACFQMPGRHQYCPKWRRKSPITRETSGRRLSACGGRTPPGSGMTMPRRGWRFCANSATCSPSR